HKLRRRRRMVPAAVGSFQVTDRKRKLRRGWKREQNPEFIFVNEIMNWSSAQRHCRQNFTDLASVRNDTDWQTIYGLVPINQNLWIGVYRDSNISWSDGSNFSITSGTHCTVQHPSERLTPA
uniref:C-type lectin domain-containing protein n=1 Tax=Oryzias latipes TaxID=8090 RepID=A0A3P9JIA3_ORYLA